jgi:hypothetical protein
MAPRLGNLRGSRRCRSKLGALRGRLGAVVLSQVVLNRIGRRYISR